MSGRRVTVRSVAPLAAAALSLVLLAGCSGSSSNAVTVAPVGRGSVTQVVQAPATVVARGTATSSSPAAGTVAAVYVKNGATVRKGQLLLRISSPSAQAALAQAVAADEQVAASGTTVTPPSGVAASAARSDAAARRAFEQAASAVAALPPGPARTAAQAQLVAAEAQYAAARAAVTQAVAQLDAGVGSATGALDALTRAQQVQTQAAVVAAQRTVGALAVHAPIAGVVTFGGSGSTASSAASSGSDLSGLLGQLPTGQQSAAASLLGGGSGTGATSVSGDLARGVPVTAGQQLLTVTDVSQLTLQAQVDETDVLTVHPGVPADVSLTAVPGATYAGRVTSVGLTPTTSSSGGVSYQVGLSLGPGRQADGTPAPTPRPGMSAVASLRVLTATDVVSVPAAAVFQDGALFYVWRVDDGRAHQQVVRVGAQGDTAYQILAGVRLGEPIVVSGVDQVREGQHVG